MTIHPAALAVDELLGACEIRRQRRSGPGGQHRNKVETAVIIRHIPSEIEVEASERRSQEQNRRVAVDRLRMQLACQVRTLPPESPSPLWQQRSRGGRVEVSTDHVDFAAILAEALDCLFACEVEIPPAAQRLGVSNSQLLKLIRRVPRAFTLMNDERDRRKMHRLK